MTRLSRVLKRTREALLLTLGIVAVTIFAYPTAADAFLDWLWPILQPDILMPSPPDGGGCGCGCSCPSCDCSGGMAAGGPSCSSMPLPASRNELLLVQVVTFAARVVLL